MGPLMQDYHAKFVAATVQRCPRTLLLFWDHQLGKAEAKRRARQHGK